MTSGGARRYRAGVLSSSTRPAARHETKRTRARCRSVPGELIETISWRALTSWLGPAACGWPVARFSSRTRSRPRRLSTQLASVTFPVLLLPSPRTHNTQVDRCMSCDLDCPLALGVLGSELPGGAGPKSSDSLLAERGHCRIWLDAKGRPMVVVTPKRHVDRLAQLSGEELCCLWRSALWATTQELGLPDFQSMIVNHGDNRNHAHLHLKVRIQERLWRGAQQGWSAERRAKLEVLARFAASHVPQRSARYPPPGQTAPPARGPPPLDEQPPAKIARMEASAPVAQPPSSGPSNRPVAVDRETASAGAGSTSGNNDVIQPEPSGGASQPVAVPPAAATAAGNASRSAFATAEAAAVATAAAQPQPILPRPPPPPPLQAQALARAGSSFKPPEPILLETGIGSGAYSLAGSGSSWGYDCPDYDPWSPGYGGSPRLAGSDDDASGNSDDLDAA